MNGRGVEAAGLSLARDRPSIRVPAWPVALAAAVPLVLFALQSHVGLGLADEGFLWYGAQRVVAGELPIRDFQAYDPGRYYWVAAWMALTGDDGIVTMRFADTILMCCTVALATLLLRSAVRRPAAVALGGATIALWLYPDFKVADSFATLLLLAGLARLLRDSTPRAWGLYGVTLGVAGVIGINHAFYGVVALALAAAYLARVAGRRLDATAIAALAAGTLVGYAPMLVVHGLAPGFTAAYVDSIRQLFEAGATNLSRPLVGLADLTRLDWGRPVEALRETMKSALFVIAPTFIAVCVWRALHRADWKAGFPHPVFVAAVLLSIPYAHYSVSRADLVHIAISALPLVVAAWTYPATRLRLPKRIGLAGVCVFSLALLVPKYPGIEALRGPPLQPVAVGRDTLQLTPDGANDIAMLQRLTAAHATDGRSFLAAPYWPGAYAVFGRRSPTWEIYALFPASAERQAREIERLIAANIGFAILDTWAVDDRADLGFRRTHPAIARHLERCMARGDDPVARPTFDLFVAVPGRCGAH